MSNELRRQIVIAAVALQSLGCAVSSSITSDATLSLTVTTEVRSSEVVTNPEVVMVLWQMFRDAGFGLRHMEEAAFVVETNTGGLILVRWPSGGEPDTARWTGPMPDGVVAIVHTHPNWEPLPSRIDIRTAQRSHVPVYVVTRTKISKTLGGPPQIVLAGDWSN